jgi:hypothetical protein
VPKNIPVAVVTRDTCTIFNHDPAV